MIDKITNSIENAVTGDSFQTEISILSKYDIKTISDKKLWVFDWKSENRDPKKEVFKLTIIHNPNVIQGLISIEDKNDHVFMHLVESASFNKGKDKTYLGVPGNLVAFACKKAFQLVMKAILHSSRNQNLLNITKRHLEQFTSVAEP